jgi:hypothetical protein
MFLYTNQYDYSIKKKSNIEKKVDEILSKKILHHLEEFFDGNKAKNNTL